MNIKTKKFEQHLYHDAFGQEDSQKYLKKTLPIVGRIVMYFNGLESELDSVICEIIHDRTDTFGLIILEKMNFSAKVDLFKRFNHNFSHSTSIKLPSYKKIVENLKKCGELRNLVVHAEWGNTDLDGYTYVKLRINMNGMQQEYVQFTEESLQEIEALILSTRTQLDIFWEKRNEKL